MSTPLPDFSLDTRESAASELTRKLMDYIVSAGFRPGDRLPSERQMAEALQVGRAGLRNALKPLSLLGVLEQRQGDGTYLRNVSSDLLPRVIGWGLLMGENKFQDVVEARENLEIILAGYAAERRSQEDVQKLSVLIRQMKEFGDDPGHYVELDTKFHLAIADTARNDVLAGILRNLQSLLHAWASRVIHTAGEASSSTSTRIAVLKAIIAGRAETARSQMHSHAARTSRSFPGCTDAETAGRNLPSGRPAASAWDHQLLL